MDLLLVPAGFAVGLLVGLTGVGGGALMTPMLILYGIPPAVAVGSDLVYAALTKSLGALLHQLRRNIRWRIVGRMALGSLPACAATLWLLESRHAAGAGYERIVTITLGGALVLTAVVTLLRPWLISRRNPELPERAVLPATVAAGAFIGVLVTLSSVGAGALGAAFLLLFYRSLPVAAVVGTDLTHAVFLAALAGAGHWHLGAVDFSLLLPLLFGSMPGLYLGTRWASRIRDGVLRPAMAGFLLMIGLGFALKALI
ncbi:MAG: sulfite exporter TauE/SafE family protein [Gammaproteobacteria bacterium]|nr:sulfite exporter TauE/SafE family protein [Gammaproteobacteria bacterium]